MTANKTAHNKMFAQWWRDAKVLSTFILQRFPPRTVAASKSHHCANTNVVAHCFMDEIVKLYNEHLTTPFPDRRGDEILGIDLVLIDSDTAGLISTYIGSRGQLSGENLRILNHCYSDLKTVVKELSGTDRQYFAQLQNIAGLIIEKLNGRRTTTDKESFKPEWEKNLLIIREILNDWDPIGAGLVVEDEYDTMNFRTLSVLMNKRDKKEIRNILADYTMNAMGLTIDNATLDRVANRISKISVD